MYTYTHNVYVCVWCVCVCVMCVCVCDVCFCVEFKRLFEHIICKHQFTSMFYIPITSSTSPILWSCLTGEGPGVALCSGGCMRAHGWPCLSVVFLRNILEYLGEWLVRSCIISYRILSAACWNCWYFRISGLGVTWETQGSPDSKSPVTEVGSGEKSWQKTPSYRARPAAWGSFLGSSKILLQYLLKSSCQLWTHTALMVE